MVGRKILLLSFWKCMCYILSTIKEVGHMGAKVGPWGTKNEFSSAPSAKRGGKGQNRGCLHGGPAVTAVTRLGPLLFLPSCPGGYLRCRIQGDLGPGSLALREGVALCRAWALSISPTFRRLGLQSGCRWFSYLLSRRRSGATGSRGRAGVFREEVSHCLRWLLRLREAFSKALHSWSKQAAWRDRRLERWLWWRIEPGLSHFSGPWERLNPDWLPHWWASCSLKRKLSESIERQDWNSRNGSSQSRWAQCQRGISPSMTHSAWVSSVCRGDMHVLQWRCGICSNA